MGTTVTSSPSSTTTPVAQTSTLSLTKSAAVDRCERRRPHRPGRQDHLVVPGQEHRHHLGDDGRGVRRHARARSLPGHVAGARGVDHLHVGAPTSITQADVDNGVVANTATVDGQEPGRRDDHLERRPARPRPSPRARRWPCSRARRSTDTNADGKTDLGDTDPVVVQGHEHRHRHDDLAGDQRRQGRGDHLPGHDAGAGRPDHLHGDDGLRHHPGRRRRRRGQQHRHGQRATRPAAARSRRARRRPRPPIASTSTLSAGQVGGRDRRQRRRQDRPRRQDHLVVRRQEHRHDDHHRGRRDRPDGRRRLLPGDDARARGLDDLYVGART